MTLRMFVAVLLACVVGLVGCEKQDAGEEGTDEGATAEQAVEGAEEEGDEEEVDEPEGDEEEAAAAEAEDEGAVNCEGVVTNTVNVLVDAQGDKAFFEKDDIPALIKGCENAGTIDENPDTAKCLNEIDSMEAMDECEGANAALKGWAEAAEEK
ncbi:MAG: hypothetical protein ACOC9J_01580 [Persicimonas sp.]